MIADAGTPLKAGTMCQTCWRAPAVKQVLSANGRQKIYKCLPCLTRKRQGGTKSMGYTNAAS